MDGGHGKTHLRPECGDDEFLAARLLHRLNDATVFPGVDEGAVNRLLIRKDRLELLEQCAAALLIDGGKNRRNAKRLRGLREPCDVVNHECGIVTVDVCQLERLVVDQEKDAILRCQQSVQADLRERLHRVMLSFPASHDVHCTTMVPRCPTSAC